MLALINIVVVELVREILMLLAVVMVLVAAWTTLGTILPVSAWTALAALTLTAWATLTLLIAFRLLFEDAVRELVLASLRINLKELDLDVVTLVDASLLDSL